MIVCLSFCVCADLCADDDTLLYITSSMSFQNPVQPLKHLPYTAQIFATFSPAYSEGLSNIVPKGVNGCFREQRLPSSKGSQVILEVGWCPMFLTFSIHYSSLFFGGARCRNLHLPPPTHSRRFPSNSIHSILLRQTPAFPTNENKAVSF